MTSQDELWEELKEEFQQQNLHALTLSNLYPGKESFPRKQVARPVVIKELAQLQWTLFDAQSRQTHENLEWDLSWDKLRSQLGHVYQNVHLKTRTEEIQIRFTKKKKSADFANQVESVCSTGLY